MKKLLGIVVSVLLMGGSAYSNEVILNCVYKNGHSIEGGKILHMHKGFKGTHDISVGIETSTKRINSFDGLPGSFAKNISWRESEITWYWLMSVQDQTVTNYRLNRLSGALTSSFKYLGMDLIKNYSCKKSNKMF